MGPRGYLRVPRRRPGLILNFRKSISLNPRRREYVSEDVVAPPETGGEKAGGSREDRILEELEALRAHVRRLEAKVDALGKPPRAPDGRVRTFVDGLDAALGGGIPKGHVVIVAGPSGTMKTSLALHLLTRNMAAGQPGVFVSLEERRDSLLATMRTLGIEPRDDFIVDIGRLRVEHERAEEAQDWLQILREFLERRRGKQPAEIIVIDPLNSLYTLANMAKPRQELFHFFNFLRSLEATTILVAESENADRPFAHQEEFLADGAIELRYTGSDDGRVAVSLRVVKMRQADHARDWYRLEFRGGTFRATPPSA